MLPSTTPRSHRISAALPVSTARRSSSTCTWKMARCDARRPTSSPCRGKPPPNTMLAASGSTATCSHRCCRTTSSTAVLPAPGPPVSTTRAAGACADIVQSQRVVIAPLPRPGTRSRRGRVGSGRVDPYSTPDPCRTRGCTPRRRRRARPRGHSSLVASPPVGASRDAASSVRRSSGAATSTSACPCGSGSSPEHPTSGPMKEMKTTVRAR